jgi:hypothetical protein
VQVCGRITQFAGLNGAQAMPGYCLQVDARGGWTLVSDSAPLATGMLPGPFNASSTHRLSLSMAGDVITAAVGGVQLTSVVDKSYAVGNAAVGSGWHVAAFDNFAVTAPTV